MDKRYFSKKLAEWYQNHKRDLPWRQTTDPYKIWLSEIILQQTRVSQGLPYYERFLEKFSVVERLAQAPEQEVLRLWQGLGYYTRARNLHKCARTIIRQYGGRFPENFKSLLALPGVGEYTAAAIASIAFKEAVAVVDGNVFRVLSRIFGVDKAINTPEGKKFFSTLANELVDELHADVHNQAIMEFGALHCTPKNPKCEDCPFQGSCVAFKQSLQHQLPVKIKPGKSKKRFFYYLVIRKGKSLLMKKREQKDIWQGLYDFPLIEKKRACTAEKILLEAEFSKNKVSEAASVKTSVAYKHILSHQVIVSKFIVVDHKHLPIKSAKNLKFFSPKKINELPKPVLISRFLSDYKFL
jgi:A/G-specific adenine glycosylase